MQNEPVNERWQALMGPYFVTGDAPADQQMRELDEVFHLADEVFHLPMSCTDELR